ncbi:unnamed protein product [Mytilus edulis]|uniref:Uncharacterized protein n=1 Tax=Mytilus edulis TaxID=6550 RepID=A0A8S3SX98_MYTED|nr:unnamed protein product [Mytilus edulis]
MEEHEEVSLCDPEENTFFEYIVGFTSAVEPISPLPSDPCNTSPDPVMPSIEVPVTAIPIITIPSIDAPIVGPPCIYVYCVPNWYNVEDEYKKAYTFRENEYVFRCNLEVLSKFNNNTDFLVESEVCKIPRVNPFDQSIKEFLPDDPQISVCDNSNVFIC